VLLLQSRDFRQSLTLSLSKVCLQLVTSMIDFKFPHTAPEGYSYEVTQFKRNILAIWICNHAEFTYTSDRPVRSIWGFYDSKADHYIAPINAKKPGKIVDFNCTTPYSAMQLNLNPLMLAFR